MHRNTFPIHEIARIGVNSGGGETTDLTRTDVLDIEHRDGKDDKITFNHAKTVDAILQKLPVALGVDDGLYYWQGEAWTDQAESIIFNMVRSLAGKLFKTYGQKEIITALRHALNFERVEFDQNPYLLGVQKGVVDLRTGVFRDYKKEDYISRQIPVKYDPLATCPGFIKFLEEVCPNVTDRLMLIDWLAIHAIGKAFPFVMFLIGRGRNGKGVYEYVLQCLYARTSFSFIGLEEINRSNFAKAFLIGKRGLIVSEVGDDSKRSKGFIPTHFLKLASGDGFIDSDRKNTTRIQFPPAFKATIDTNDMPTIADTSRGWAERFCKADLPYHFVDNPDTDNPREKKKDPHLKAKLTTPEELSGILNLIIYRAMEICKTETIIKRSGSEMVAEYQVQSGSVKAFLEKYCEYVPYLNGALVEAGWYLDEIYQAYSDWCTHPGINADKVDDKRFGSSVKKFCSGAHSTKERVGAKQRRKYRGLMFFKENYEKDMESLSAPLVPLNSINVPLKSITAPLVPLNDNIWISIREKFSLSSIEKNVEKRPFNGYNGAPIDSNGAIKIVNGSQMEPTAKFNGTASSDAPTRKKRKSPLDF